MYKERHKDVPKVVLNLIEKMIDEDSTYSAGTAEKAANQLLERSIKCGREGQFKAAMKFWKGSINVPESVIWQWFGGVFKGAKRSDKNRPKHKPRRRGRPKN